MNYHAHSEYLQQIKFTGDYHTAYAALKKILDEAAYCSQQGGGINYQHMLSLLIKSMEEKTR